MSVERFDGITRKQALEQSSAAGFAAVAAAFAPLQVLAADDSPVAIMGAGGKTGKECVKALLARGIPCRAVTRSGSLDGVSDDKLLAAAAGDVTRPDTLDAVTRGAKAVIFASSASKKGGTAEAVDYQGLVNVAKACLANDVPRLVIVSSGSVSKPNSPVYKFLNLFGEIMKYKALGEGEVRSLYASSNKPCYYTIVRPGGLTTDAGLGVSALELNQGDTISGRIARADVAAICVESIFSDATRDATFECYNADSSKPLDSVGISNILKQKADVKESSSSLSATQRRGSTWAELFAGLKSDAPVA